MSLPDLSGFKEETVTMEPVENDEELFLIRVPKGFDINKLNGVKFAPPGIAQVEAKKGKHGMVSTLELGSCLEKNLDVNVLINSNNKSVAGPCIKQCLCVTKSVQMPSSPLKPLENSGSSHIPLPAGLREHFTPFGADHPVRRKSKKRKRKRSVDEADFEVDSKRRKLKKKKKNK